MSDELERVQVRRAFWTGFIAGLCFAGLAGLAAELLAMALA
jgi:hypothetical protein